MAMETQDIIKRSATNPITPAPRARDYKAEVAKLIDVSSCVGCKACQVACSEWNDIRDEVGHCVGVYDNPADLSAKSWTVMRFSETDQNGKLEWLIRKDGCMHCEDPGCLKACPSAGAIIQYANGIVDFQQDNCIGCGYCIAGCPFNIPRLNKEDNRVYKCTLCVDRVSVGQEPACVKTCPTGAIHFGTKKRCWKWRSSGWISSKRAAMTRPGFITRRAWAARTSCMFCTTMTSRSCIIICRKIRRSIHQSTCGKGRLNRFQRRALSPPLPG
ncbi:Formate dehydrogenase N beta subunit [Enterobacter hormaechei]|nr:Formate dehydrogenase N beta subunit [Enterobacter hormaechei]